MQNNKKTSKNVMKKLICFGIVTTSFIVSGAGFNCTNEVYAATATIVKEIKNNGYNGIKIDINAAPYTTFSKITDFGKYAYGESGCAWFASSRVRQVTGKCSTIWSGLSWYNTQHNNFGFSRGTTPKAKSLACFKGHVAFVESVSGNDMVISEGGSRYYSDAEHGYCIIRKVNIKNYESNMGTEFLGYVYLDAKSDSSTKTDTTKLTASKTTASGTVATKSDTTKKSASSEEPKKTTESKKIVSKWVRDSETGAFMYYGADGKKYTGWHYMGYAEGETTPHWSFFGKDGFIYTGWRNMGKAEGENIAHLSYFGPNGWLRTNWAKMGTAENPDGNSEVHWSYFGPNGWLRTDWQKMGTAENPDGNDPVHWSYFGPNGWLRTGWQKMGTKENPDGNSRVHYSYFGSYGWLVTGKQFIGGKTYTFDSSGWSI